MVTSPPIGDKYLQIAEYYERCLAEHGPNYRGMNWPNEADLEKRHRVMLDVIREKEIAPTVLDLGCGIGLLVDYMEMREPGCPPIQSIQYWGIDISTKMIEIARERHPEYLFLQRDILLLPLPPKCVGYIIMNGLLTERAGLSFEEMEGFAKTILRRAFDACRLGMAFNAMSIHVDWQRDDLFHWPLDWAVAWLKATCSPHVVIRHDYGLHEWTAYVYREASA